MDIIIERNINAFLALWFMERYVPSRDIEFACHPHRMACSRFVDEGILNFVLVAAQSREGAIRGRTGTAGPTGMAGTTGML